MEHLGKAWNGSEGKATAGYWLISLIAHNEEKENIIPLYKELYSQNSPDRGGDRKNLFKELDKNRSEFLISCWNF